MHPIKLVLCWCLLPFFALLMMVATPGVAEEAEPDADACFFAGKAFSSGATLKTGGEQVHCFKGFGSIFWVDVSAEDTEGDAFVFCMSDGEYYSFGAVLGERTCNGNGNWD